VNKNNRKQLSTISSVLLKYSTTLITFSVMLTMGQLNKKLSLGEQTIFRVSKASEVILVDGKINEIIWNKTEARKLNYFYNTDQPDDAQQTIYACFGMINTSMYSFR
jgi:hypothetical protein